MHINFYCITPGSEFTKKPSSFCLSLISNSEKTQIFEYVFVLGEGGLSIGTCAQSHYDLCICTIKMCSNQIMNVINHNRIPLLRQYMLDHDIDMKKISLNVNQVKEYII